MKLYTTLLLLFFTLTFSSCEKLLDKDPTDKISIEDLFKDVAGAKTALAGAYSSLLSSTNYQLNSMVYPDLLGGNIKYSQLIIIRLDDIYNAAQTPAESQMNDTYAALYSEINNVNNILKYTAAAEGRDSEKIKIIAEAKCLRALMHFDLLRTFARPYNYTADASHPGIVINLEPRLLGDLTAVRATAAASYQAVITDLEEAIGSFDASNVGVLSSGLKQNYFTVSSAKALLAKVYLYANNWDKAYALADEIIKSNQYTLLSNTAYVASWTGRAASTESVFELPIETTASGNSLGSYYSLNDHTYRAYAATTDLLNLYKTTDVRRAGSLFNLLTINGSPFYFSKKYSAGGVNATPVKLLRLSELYLIRAEAAAEKSTPDFTVANADLNTLIKRADASAATVRYTDKATLLDAIMLERRKELAFEGNLLFDLARKKIAVTRTDCSATPNCNLAADDYRLVMPFPFITINANRNVVQNEGY
jgi:hypothetical protein